jgi:hypothetical protein
LGDPSAVETIILKWIFKKKGWRWLRIGTGGGLS